MSNAPAAAGASEPKTKDGAKVRRSKDPTPTEMEVK